ncbi:hypothetical protein, partial [Anaplasma phagocytophilum]
FVDIAFSILLSKTAAYLLHILPCAASANDHNVLNFIAIGLLSLYCECSMDITVFCTLLSRKILVHSVSNSGINVDFYVEYIPAYKTRSISTEHPCYVSKFGNRRLEITDR